MNLKNITLCQTQSVMQYGILWHETPKQGIHGKGMNWRVSGQGEREGVTAEGLGNGHGVLLRQTELFENDIEGMGSPQRD